MRSRRSGLRSLSCGWMNCFNGSACWRFHFWLSSKNLRRIGIGMIVQRHQEIVVGIEKTGVYSRALRQQAIASSSRPISFQTLPRLLWRFGIVGSERQRRW